MDYLTLALCISIGTGVPWLNAIYSDNGARHLIGNSVFSLAGTVAGASLLHWISPTYGLIGVVVIGPAVAVLAMVAGQAAKRAVLSRLSRTLR